MAAHPVVDAAVTPFPPPPKFYEEFEPHAVADFKMPAPPKPIEGPYVMFGTMYDTTFGPQHPSTALEAYRIKVEDDSSPIATLRQLNRALPEEYLKLMEMLIERPVICTSAADQEKIRSIDEQRSKVEAMIGAMHLSLSRFRPFQARQALITTLRAQVHRRKQEATSLRECRERAQALIGGASGQLQKAKVNLEARQQPAGGQGAAADGAAAQSKAGGEAEPKKEAKASEAAAGKDSEAGAPHPFRTFRLDAIPA
ncbi:MED7 protein-domain-containing protein [Baffinella frigidus]|nr:MED7 protein-domain-containing protein [Cryptophyta sp. CCMP2293]